MASKSLKYKLDVLLVKEKVVVHSNELHEMTQPDQDRKGRIGLTKTEQAANLKRAFAEHDIPWPTATGEPDGITASAPAAPRSDPADGPERQNLGTNEQDSVPVVSP